MIDGSSKLNALLQKVPKSISLDDISSLNLTLISDPVYSNTSIEFDINGIFSSSSAKEKAYNMWRENNSQNGVHLSSNGEPKMFMVAIDEEVLNSALQVYFQVIFVSQISSTQRIVLLDLAFLILCRIVCTSFVSHYFLGSFAT